MSGGAPGRREVAHRIFACEFEDATYSYTESDEERAPKYVVTPTGARINRMFVVGVLTAVERVNEETVRARVVDPTGAFVVYASQYQPDARAQLEEIQPPAYVAVTGKANTFRPDGADRIYTSIRPEAVAVVDEATRDRWTLATAEHTLDRLARMAEGKRGDASETEGVSVALEQYDPTPAYLAALHRTAIDTIRLVAGEIESVDVPDLDLDASGEPSISLGELANVGRRRDDQGRHASDPEPDESDDVGPPDETEETGDVESAPPTEAASTGPSEQADALDAGEAIDEPDPPEPADEEEVLSADERASIEAEYGTEFTTGDEVDAPAAESTDVADESAPAATDEDPTTDSAADRLVALLEDLDEGSGVERERLREAALERLELDEDDIEDALRTALMDGRCYESETDVFRSI